MPQRPQPSLRLADGGNFITRWARGVMRPDNNAKRLREIEAPPPPPPAAPPPPPPPPPNPNATPGNPAGIRFQDGGGFDDLGQIQYARRQRGLAETAQDMAVSQAEADREAMGMVQRGEAQLVRLQDGGHVPGTGKGDKIPAKYEPGEFVVSNDMIDDNPGLREQLASMRAETLAARGKTVEEADAKALNGGRRPSLRAQVGYYGAATPPEDPEANARRFANVPPPTSHQPGRTVVPPVTPRLRPGHNAPAPIAAGDQNEQVQRPAGGVPLLPEKAMAWMEGAGPTHPNDREVGRGVSSPVRSAGDTGVPRTLSYGESLKVGLPDTSAVVAGTHDDVRHALGQGRYASAVMKGLRGSVTLPFAALNDTVGAAARSLKNPAEDAFRGLFGMEDRPLDAPPATSAPDPAPAPAVQPNPTDMRLAAGTQRSPLGNPFADDPKPAASSGNQIMPGVYSHGRGQYSDSADGMGFSPGFTGRPNAQNMAAADALAARSQAESMARLRGAGMGGGGPGSGPVEPGSFTGGVSGVIGSADTYGNMRGRSPEQQRRDAEVSASSIHAPTAALGKAKLAALDAQQSDATKAGAERYKADSTLRGNIYQADSSRESYAYTADQKLKGDTIGAQASLRNNRARMQYDMAKDQRSYNLDVEKYGLEKANAALKQRESSEKVLREQILGQLPQVRDKEGKMVPDEQGAAQYMRAAYARLSDRETALREALQKDPSNAQAAAELESLRHYGLGALSADPAANNKFMVGMQARSAIRDNAGWAPWSADRAGGASSKAVTSLRKDDGALLGGYRDQDNNWVPDYAVERGGNWFGPKTDKFKSLIQE